MQEKVEKYIYYIRDNKYRLKILKYSKEEEKYIRVDAYINDTLENVVKYRDEILKKHGISLNKEEKKDIFEITDSPKKKNKPKKERATNKEDKNKVDKYIYEIEKNKKYRVFIRKGGSNGQKGDYFSQVINGSLAAAKKIRDLKLAEFKLKKGDSVNKSNIKFIDFVKIYFKEYAEKELSPATYQKDKRDVSNYLLPYLAYMPLSKIDALVVQKMINELKEKDKQRPEEDGSIQKLSSTTVDGAYRTLRKILNKAIAWDYLEKNPVEKVKAPGLSKNEKNSYNREELLKILDLLAREDSLSEAFFTLAICTGLRRGEIVGLHLSDIDFENNVIFVNRTVVYDEKKGKSIEKETKTKGSVREVPVPLFCMDIIKDYIKIRSKIIQRAKRKNKNYISIDNLFVNQYGQILFPDTLSNKWLKFRRKHKELKKVTLHGLRHSYCTMQMNENPNLSPADVQKLMGHSQLTTTYIYTHSNEDKKKETISIFDKYYSVNKEKQLDFNQITSIYLNKNFIPTNKKNELINELVVGDMDLNEKIKIIKEEIEKKYFYFKDINDNNITVDNIFDWLDECKNKYGNEFVLSINKLGQD